jgi:ribonuclease HI
MLLSRTKKAASSFLTANRQYSLISTAHFNSVPSYLQKSVQLDRLKYPHDPRYKDVELRRLLSTTSSDNQNEKHLSRTDIRKMRVAELREELKKRGLPIDGLRKDLVDKMLESLDNSKESQRVSRIPKPSSSKSLSNDNLYVLRFYGDSKHMTVSASCGLVLYDSETSKIKWEGRMYLRHGESAQEAEYVGLKYSLPLLYNLGLRKLIIQGNIKSTVVNHLQGNYQVKTKNMQRLFEYVNGFINKELDYCEVWGIQVDQNKKAKSLAKKAMDTRSSDGFKTDKDQNKEEHDTDQNESKSTQERNKAAQDTNKEEAGIDINESVSREDRNRTYTSSKELSEDEVSKLNKDEEENKCNERMKYRSAKINQENNDKLILPTLSSDKVYVLRFDGGSRGNPGTAGAGMVIFDSESQLEVWSAYKYLGQVTNNIAEYNGLHEGLKLAKVMGVKHLIAEGDSQLIIKQVNGEYKVNKQHLKQLYQNSLSLSKQFRSFRLSYIPRAENFRADQLANVAMDKQSSFGIVESNENFNQEEEASAIDQKIHWGENKIKPQENFESKGSVKMDGMIELPHPTLSNIQIQARSDTIYNLKICISKNPEDHTHGAGIGLYDNETGGEIWSGRYFMSEDVSSNIATYIAVIIGLRCASSFGAKRIHVEAKSDLIINQMKGKFKVKSEKLIPYHRLAKETSLEFASFDIMQLKDDSAENILRCESKKAIKHRRSEL